MSDDHSYLYLVLGSTETFPNTVRETPLVANRIGVLANKGVWRALLAMLIEHNSQFHGSYEGLSIMVDFRKPLLDTP